MSEMAPVHKPAGRPATAEVPEASEFDAMFARIEAATGADRDIDRDLHRLLFPDDEHHCMTVHIGAGGFYNGYTKYIGAAINLMFRALDDRDIVAWHVGYAYNGGPYDARILRLNPEEEGEELIEVETTHGESVALALCAAIVKSRSTASGNKTPSADQTSSEKNPNPPGRRAG
jgi:hypothetical protein